METCILESKKNEGKMHTQMHTLSTRFVFANTKMHTQTHT